MKQKLFLPIIFFILIFTPVAGSWAQKVDVEKSKYNADKFFSIKNYKAALPLYEEVIKAGSSDPVYHFRLGKCYMESPELNDQMKATPYLKYALNNKNKDVSDEIYYLLGKNYHKTMEIVDAMDMFEKYKKAIGTTDKAKVKDVDRQLEVCKNALTFISKKRNIVINNLGSEINSEFTEYNPVVSTDESVLAYTALRPNSDRTRSTADFVEEILISTKDGKNSNWSAPKVLKINSRFNVGTAGISPDGEKMLIFIGGPNGTGNIYTTDRQGKDWSTPAQIGNHVNSNFLESTASITPDGKTVYFASNRPGGFGGMDIYKVERSEKGWGQAINLGPTVNTSFDDDAPFIHPDGKTLFFTSEGHNSMGGKDIFRTVLVGGKWIAPENMGFPINTPANDNYFTLTADGSKGYFSSDRQGGYGGQDIYSFNMPEEEANIPLTLVKGRILAGEELKPVPTKIKVIDNATKTKIDYVYNPNKETGNYLIIFPPGKNYDMVIESEGYMPYTLNINVPNQNYFYELYQQIHLKPIKHFDVIVGQEVTVKNAFYDTKEETKTELRKTNEAMLVKNDSVDIYELMDGIIAASDSDAYEYLLDLMYKTNPIDNIDFDKAGGNDMERAKRVYYYDESDESTLEAKSIGDEIIYSLPTLFVTEEAKKQKETKMFEAKYDKKLLEPIYKVYFDTDKSDLKSTYHSMLNDVLKALQANPDLGIEISGFASPDGNAEYNTKLSNQRAIEVLNFFNYKGIVRRRIIAKGFGSTQATKVTKEESRRVEIRIIDLNNYK
jgi:outer membrane protein OmpA-like peptidoglycan-associated protein